MLEAIYVTFLKKNSFQQYHKLWNIVAPHMVSYRGAVESKIYFSDHTNFCLIHSRWPSESLQKKSWPLPEAAPQFVKDAAKEMETCRANKAQQLWMDLNSLEQYIQENQLVLHENIKSQRKQILLYNDEGCGDSVYELIDQLKKTTDLNHCRLLIVDSAYINQQNWEPKTQLLIMPGGRARPYYTSLGAIWETENVEPGVMRKLKDIGEGNHRIRRFVENGGNFLGICAGGYYGANKTVFERGGKLEVIDEGALKFFEGVAEGPAYGLGKFDYDSETGSEIAEIQSDKIANCTNLSVYFNGGCYLHMEETETPHKNVLAYYNNLYLDKQQTKKRIAIVENQCGFGTAILSGVHFEQSSLSPGIKNTEKLAKQDGERLLFFARVVNRLGVVLNPSIYNQIYAQQPALKSLKLNLDVSEIVTREHFQEIDSTQTYSQQQIKKLELGKWLLVTADTQTKGIGTSGRNWISPEGNLYATFSTVILSEHMHVMKCLSHITALSVAQVFENLGLKATLKWPNDLLISGKKVAGILCQTAANVLHIGIGINVNMSQIECDLISQPATSINIALGGKEISKGYILNLLQSTLIHNINYLINFSDGHEMLNKRINEMLAFKDETIYFDTENENYRDGRVIKCILTGINSKGHLIVTIGQSQLVFVSGRILKGNELQQHEETMQIKPETDAKRLNQFGIFSDPSMDINFLHTHFAQPIPSTQDYVRDNADMLFAKTNAVVVTANEQTKGRGTQNRMWASPPDVNIYATFGIILPNHPEKLQQMKDHPITTQIAVLSVAKTLEEYGFEPKIKWRNDLLVNGKKICGILCEPIENMQNGKAAGMIGIGLNVNMSEEICKTLDQPVTSMAVEGGRQFNKEEVLQKLQLHLAHYIKVYFGQSFAMCQIEISQRLAYVGKAIQLQVTESADQSAWEIIQGVFESVDEIGRLNLRLADESLRTIAKGRILKEHECVPSLTLSLTSS